MSLNTSPDRRVSIQRGDLDGSNVEDHITRSLRGVRLAKAKETLKHTTASISGIVYLCDF